MSEERIETKTNDEENSKKEKVGKKLFKTMQAKVIAVMSLLIVALCVVLFLIMYKPEPVVEPEPFITTIEKASELTTGKLTYKTLYEYKDKGVPIFNKSNFVMYYEATARIGIDVKEVDVKCDNTKKVISIYIPKAKVLDVKINTNKIKYYDEKFSLFNVNEKEDQNKAISKAEEDARQKIEEMGSLKMADDQAETLIKGLISELIPNGYITKVIPQ